MHIYHTDHDLGFGDDKSSWAYGDEKKGITRSMIMKRTVAMGQIIFTRCDPSLDGS